MDKFSTLTTYAVALEADNIDTDQIMPKQFLRGIDKAGLDKGLFYNLKHKPDGSLDSGCVLNSPTGQKAALLLAGPNFGCGSSREHAVWGLMQGGFKVVAAANFGEIFYSNCFNNGLLACKVVPEDMEKLFSAMPRSWVLYQNFLFVDAGTFLQYNANMRPLVVDKIQACQLVVFNRTSAKTDKMEFHKIVRGLNRRCSIAFEWPDGKVEYDEIQDPLPFDLSAPVVQIGDEDYAIWYRDIIEEMDKYQGKTVEFTGLIAVSGRLPQDCFLGGRHVMTCCEADMSFLGFPCKYGDAASLKTKDWVRVQAEVRVEYQKEYRGEGPVLYAKKVERDKEIKDIVTF